MIVNELAYDYNSLLDAFELFEDGELVLCYAYQATL